MCNPKSEFLDGLRVPVALAYMIAILWMSSMPGVISEDATPMHRMLVWIPSSVQNLLHLPVYAGLAFVWCGVLGLRLSRPWYLFGGAFLVTVGFGIVDEWYQSFIPGRFASIGDILVDALGAVLGISFFSYIFGKNADEAGPDNRGWRARLRHRTGRKRGWRRG